MAARPIGAEVCVRRIQTNTNQLDELGWQSPLRPRIGRHLNGLLRPEGVPFPQLAQRRRPRGCSLLAAQSLRGLFSCCHSLSSFLAFFAIRNALAALDERHAKYRNAF